MDSDGSYSDLTDIESDAYTEKSKRKGIAQKGGGYRIRNALRVPRATTYTAQSLYDQIHGGDIILDPEYQREVVWPETKQIGIIDSIFRNFYIPPVIFAVSSTEDGVEKRTCIDGKQRLTSIHRFMDGIIPHKDPLTSEKLWYTDVHTGLKGSRAKKLLPEKYRRLFANKQVVCVEYQDITDSDEREIFQRVQLGMALTPAEKLQVISTSRASFVRELQTTFLKEDNGLTGEALEWDRSRGSDFRCLAQAVFCIEKYGPTLKNAGTIVKLEKWLSDDDDFSRSFKDKVKNVFRVFLDLVLDGNLNKAFKKPAKVSPIEFILISLLVAVHKDKMSKAQLSAAIGKMRTDVRDVHTDIRMNDRVAKTMLEFIRSAKPIKIPGDDGRPAGTPVGEKRKRSDEDLKPNAKKPPPATPSSASLPAIPRPSSSLAALPSKPPYFPPNPPSSSRGHPTPTSTPSSVAVPDRMAAVRAAKLLASQNSFQSSYRPTTQPSSAYPLQSNYSAPQLPSPGQAFTLRSNQGTPSQQPLPQAQWQQQQIPNSLDAALMAHMTRPTDNRTRLENPGPPPYDHGPSGNYSRDFSNPRDSGGGSNGRRSSFDRGGYGRQSDTGWGGKQGR